MVWLCSNGRTQTTKPGIGMESSYIVGEGTHHILMPTLVHATTNLKRGFNGLNKSRELETSSGEPLGRRGGLETE
jgi:hypothetical protein